MPYTLGVLKNLCNILRVDEKTRMIAYGLFNTNPRAAFHYVDGYPRRIAIERQKLNRLNNA